MSEFFAEATVRIKPDLTGFITSLRSQLKTAITAVETTNPPKVKIAPALTANFIGDLRRQVNTAVTQAQKGIKPIQIRAVLDDTSRRQIANVLREQTRTVRTARITQPTIPGGAGIISGGLSAETAALLVGLGGAAAEIEKLSGVTKAFAPTQERMAALYALGGRNLEYLTASTTAAAAAAEKGAAAASREGGALARLGTEAQMAGAKLKGAAAVQAQFAGFLRDLPATEQLRSLQQLRRSAISQRSVISPPGADIAILPTGVRGEVEAYDRVIGDLSKKITALESESAALRTGTARVSEAFREQEAAAVRAARSQAQLRRGALATSLSFLGIRGATLAASASFLAGAAAIAVFAQALQNATAFTDQLNVFQATTAATARQMSLVRDAARALGVDLTLPGVTASDAASAMTELAKAGLSVEDSIEGARGVLQLGIAAAIDFAQAVELAANAINAFGLEGKDATRVADVFANSANMAQGSIVDIGIAFQQAAAAGRQVGLTFEDTSLYLTELAQNGLRGSDAGTSLRTALLRLIKPTKQAAEVMKKLGIEVRDAQGNLRPDVFIQITEATKNLSPAARDAVIALIGGQDAFRAISILGRQTINEFIGMRKELRQQGTAADLAAARMQGLRGSLEALANVLSTIGTRVGQAVTPALQGVVEGVTAVAIAMSQSTEIAQLFSSAIDMIEGSLSALENALGTVAPLLADVAGGILAVTNAIGAPTIIAGIAAWKLLPGILTRVKAAAIGLSTVLAVTTAAGASARAATLGGLPERIAASMALGNFLRGAGQVDKLGVSVKKTSDMWVPFTERARQANVATAAMGSAAGVAGSRISTLGVVLSSLKGTLIQVGIFAAAAGLAYLVTRESEAEKATKRLSDAIDELNESFSRTATARKQAFQATTGLSAARLAVFEAKQRKTEAAQAVRAAPAGTFEATKATLEFRVASDNLKIALENLKEAQSEVIQANWAYQTEQRKSKEATEQTAKAINDQMDAELNRIATVGQTSRGKKPADISPVGVSAYLGMQQKILSNLDKEIQKELDLGTLQGKRTATRLQMLKSFIRLTQTVPDEETVELVVTTPNINTARKELISEFRRLGIDGIDEFKQAITGAAAKEFRTGLQKIIDGINDIFKKGLGKGGKEAGDEWSRTFGGALKSWADAIAAAQVAALTAATQKALAAAASTATKLIIAEASNASNAVLLAIAQQGYADAVAAKKKLEADIKSGKRKRFVMRDGKQVDLLEEASQEVNARKADVERYQGAIDQAAREQADKITSARNAADQLIVDAINGYVRQKQSRQARTIAKAEIRATNALDAALDTQQVFDDIKAYNTLIQLTKQEIAFIQKEIKDTNLKRELVEQLTDELKGYQRARAKAIAQRKANQAARIDAILQERVDRADANIEYAQIKENVALEIKAHNAKIKALQAQMRRLVQEKGQRVKNTAAYLRLRNAVAAEQKAIAELRGQTKQRNDEIKRLNFEFLQTLTGFTANLLGNLIPGSLTGLVGTGIPIGGTKPGAGVTTGTAATAVSALPAGVLRGDRGGPPGMPVLGPGGSVAAAVSKQSQVAAGVNLGPSRGQANDQIHLLRQVVHLLKEIKRGSDFPEARGQSARAASAHDYGSGGGGAAVSAA